MEPSEKLDEFLRKSFPPQCGVSDELYRLTFDWFKAGAMVIINQCPFCREVWMDEPRQVQRRNCVPIKKAESVK